MKGCDFFISIFAIFFKITGFNHRIAVLVKGRGMKGMLDNGISMSVSESMWIL
jgi:hypothetical protein